MNFIRRERETPDIGQILSKVSTKLRELEEAFDSVESDLSDGEMETSSMKNLKIATELSGDVNMLLRSMQSIWSKRIKAEEEFLNLPELGEEKKRRYFYENDEDSYDPWSLPELESLE